MSKTSSKVNAVGNLSYWKLGLYDNGVLVLELTEKALVSILSGTKRLSPMNFSIFDILVNIMMDHEDTDNDEVKVVGQYRLTKTLGKGTFGKVKQAEHTPTGQIVAVKVLQKQLICQQADVERISRQIKILKLIKHDSLIQMYEIIEQPQQLYLIMEYANGGDLFQQIVDSQKLKQEDAATYFYQIMLGVKYFHSLGITHRDLKPQNILLDDKKIKIADFGLGNFFKQGDLLKTACGSPCYAAPQMVSKLKYNPCKIDIWSCGVILYAMNCGYLPFEDKNVNTLYNKIKKGQFRMPSHLSENLKNLLKCILNTNPQERYTIDQILAHPWMQQNARRVDSTSEQLNAGLIQSVSDQYGYDKDKLQRALESNKHNAMTTTYYLCAKKEQIKNRQVVVREVKDEQQVMKEQTNTVEPEVVKLQDNHEQIRVASADVCNLVQEESIVEMLNINEAIKDQQLLISQQTFVTEDSTLKKSEVLVKEDKHESHSEMVELEKEPKEILIEEQQIQPPSPVKEVKQPAKNAKAILDPTKKRKSIPSITQLLSRPSVKEPKTAVVKDTKDPKDTKDVKPNNRYQISQKSSNISISMNNTQNEVQKPQKLQKIPRMKIEGMKKTATKLYERSTSRSTESVRFGAKKPQRKFTWRRVEKKPRLINAGLLYVGNIEDLKRYMLQNEPTKQDLHFEFYEMRENVLYIFRSSLDQVTLHRHLTTLLHRP